jgi:hypothetical protein
MNKPEDRTFSNQEGILPLNAKSLMFNVGHTDPATNLNIFTSTYVNIVS